MDERHSEYVAYYRVRAAKCDGKPCVRGVGGERASKRALLTAFESAADLEDAAAIVERDGLAVRNAAALVRDQERARAAFYDELVERAEMSRR